MRKFLLTSTKYNGTVSITYTADDIIDIIDFSESQISYKWRQVFKISLPLLTNDFLDMMKRPNANHFTVIETEMIVPFETFWEAYQKKIHKKRCLPVWDKMQPIEKLKALTGIKHYDRYLEKKNREKLDPENWLKYGYETDYETELKNHR